MPYVSRSGRWQHARSTGHVPIVENEFVRTRLRSFRIFATENQTTIEPKLIIPASELGKPGEAIRWVLAFDGSAHEVAVREQYPSTRIGYMQIAGVLADLQEMLGQEAARLVDPRVIHDSTKGALHSIVLPGSNVCRPDMPTVRDSWRAEVFDVFRENQIEGLSLLDVYMLLVSYSEQRAPNGNVRLARCSTSDICAERGIDVPRAGRTCPSCGGKLFPTDALRIHEEVSEEHGNGIALGRLMTVLEHLTLIAYLRYLSERQPRILGHVAFLLDGPLAIFGPPAWLRTAIASFLDHLYRDLQRQRLRFPVIVGIDKTGHFAEHAAAIRERIPMGHLMCLPDEYIYQHILTFRPTEQAPFGRNTYYGQRYFYRTIRGQMLTITFPKAGGGVSSLQSEECHPGLPDALALLDRLGTVLYRDGVIPVALAHTYASIPLRTGSKVLKLLSREFLSVGGYGIASSTNSKLAEDGAT